MYYKDVGKDKESAALTDFRQRVKAYEEQYEPLEEEELDTLLPPGPVRPPVVYPVAAPLQSEREREPVQGLNRGSGTAAPVGIQLKFRYFSVSLPACI